MIYLLTHSSGAMQNAVALMLRVSDMIAGYPPDGNIKALKLDFNAFRNYLFIGTTTVSVAAILQNYGLNRVRMDVLNFWDT